MNRLAVILPGLALLVSATTATPAIATPPNAATAATAAATVVARSVSAQAAGGYITKITYANGDILQVYDSSAVKVDTPVVTSTTTGSGSSATTEYAETTSTMADASTAKPAASPVPADFPDDYTMLIAMGVSPEDAAPFKSADAAPVSRVAPTSGSITPKTTAGPGQLYSRTCVDKSFDGAHGHMHGCDSQYRVWINPSNSADWYMEDNHLATATMHDTAVLRPDKLTGLLFGVSYHGGNVMYNWSPTTTSDLGSCKTTTTSISVKLFSTSNSATSCPATWGVYSITNTTFTTKWNGKGNGPHDGARATHGVNSLHNPPSAPANRWLDWTYWWVV